MWADHSDAELVMRARNNQMKAFQLLVERHKKKVYYTAYGVLGNHHDAEDVMQEAILQALKSLGKLRKPGGFGAWIVRISFNRSIDVLRKKKREIDPEISEDGLSLFDRLVSAAPESNPDRLLNSEEISSRIKLTLDVLPETQKNAFMLKHIADLSIKEIAEVTNSTESTVKTNIYRAVKKMRQALLPNTENIESLSKTMSSKTYGF